MVVAAGLFAAGCASTAPPVDFEPTSTASTSEPPNSTPTLSTPSSDASTTEVEIDADALAAWDRVWEILESETVTPEQQAEAPVADPEIFDNLRLLTPNGGTTSRHPIATQADDTTAEILDCVILPSPVPADSNGSVQVKVALTQTDTGWMITELVGWNLRGCVPRRTAEDSLLAYEAYWAVYSAIWDPPNPTDPGIAQTITGPALEETLRELDEFADRGEVFRASPVLSAEIVGLSATNEVIISDCQLLDLGYGVYNGATGERTPNSPAVTDGDRQHLLVTIRKTGGTWRVAFVGEGKAAGECETAPTEAALVVHG